MTKYRVSRLVDPQVPALRGRPCGLKPAACFAVLVGLLMKRSTEFSSMHGYAAGLVVLAALVMGVSGCSLMVDPFTDELAGQPPVMTPSAQGALAAEAAPTSIQRGHARMEVLKEIGAVTHGPLYFEDGFEDGGSDDDQFAWTKEDYLQLFYWRGRFLVNAVFFPISVVAAPPQTVMVSDGRISRELAGVGHDAERWVEGPPEAEAAPPPLHPIAD